jgi:hypothetical protein
MCVTTDSGFFRYNHSSLGGTSCGLNGEQSDRKTPVPIGFQSHSEDPTLTNHISSDHLPSHPSTVFLVSSSWNLPRGEGLILTFCLLELKKSLRAGGGGGGSGGGSILAVLAPRSDKLPPPSPPPPARKLFFSSSTHSKYPAGPERASGQNLFSCHAY